MTGNNPRIVWVRNYGKYLTNQERAEVQLPDGRRLTALQAREHKDSKIQGWGFKAVRLNQNRAAQGD